MRVYVPASVDDLRELGETGRLGADEGRAAFAVTSWAVRELGVDDPEDEQAEHAVLAAAADQEVAGSPCAAVLVLDLPGVDPAHDAAPDSIEVVVRHDLPRRRLAAIHLPPDLDWYAAQELPDVLGTLA